MKGLMTKNEDEQNLIMFDCKECYNYNAQITSREKENISLEKPVIFYCYNCNHRNKITGIID